MAEDGIKLHRGLREVYIDRTNSSFIDGKAGKLYYRGYNIDDLAQNCSFEEVIYLVMIGNLPTVDELSDFKTFSKVVKSVFTHRRKKIRNCLKLTFPDLEINNLNFVDERAEVLSPSQIADLSNQIFKRLSE